MKKLIMVPGNVSSPFFLNELEIALKYYDKVSIIDFGGKKEIGKKITEQYGIKYIQCAPSVGSISFWQKFARWLHQEHVKEEIKDNFEISYKGIKKIAYILFYGMYCVQGESIIDAEIAVDCQEDIDLYAYWLSRPAYLVAQYKQKNDRINSIISRAHRYDLYFDRNSVHYLPFRKFIDSSIDVIYFISENGRKYYESEYPKKGVQLKCIRKVARLGTYNGEYQKTGELNRRIVLVSCSNIISVKRLDLIVDVLEKLKHYEIMWYHFGTGKLEKEIERYCKEKLTKDSYKLCGYVDNKEILKKYKEYNANFFINMSDSEGIPVSIMEAMSFGIPVIARNVGGMSEIVNEENGLLLENDDAEDAANKISSLLTDCREKTGKYETMCKKAYDTWNERYNAEKNYNIFYSQMMKGEKRGD